jgi:dUTP pyrophosphatase
MSAIKIKPLIPLENFNVPSYQTSGSAGFDLCAVIKEPVIIKSGEWKLIPTGMAIELDCGFEAQIRPRSGLALKNGVTVLNSPGTIDSDYRGEIAVILINHSKVDFTITNNMRIAQMVIAPCLNAKIELVGDLATTERGLGGFGSTGTH